MRRIIIILSVLLVAYQSDAQMVNNIPNYLYSGSLGVGRNVANDANVYLQVGPNGSSTKGVLLPRAADTSAISGTKRNGLLIYSNQLAAFAYFDSTSAVWRKLGYTDTTVISTKANAQKVVNDTAAVLRTLVGNINTSISGLTAATGTNTIDNTNYLQTWNWSTMTSGALKLTSTSTAGADSNAVLNIERSGANATSSRVSIGIKSFVQNAGSSPTNYGGWFKAAGSYLGNGLYAEGNNYGVEAKGETAIFGTSTYAGGTGVYGLTAQNSGTNYGVKGLANGTSTTNYGGSFSAQGAGTNNYGVSATATGAGTTNYAGFFNAVNAGNNYAIFTQGGKILFQDLISTGAKFVKTNALGQLYVSDTLSASGAPISGLTAATGTNTIDNAAYAQEWQWNTLTANALNLTSTSTAGTGSSTNTILNLLRSGANSNSTVVTNGIKIAITNSGTSSTNHGLYIDASGATSNYGIRSSGSTAGVYGLSLNSGGIGLQAYANGANSYGISSSNASTSGTNYAGYFQSSGSGATTNYGGYFTASGATTNYALVTDVGRVGFGTTTPNASAIVEIASTTQGLLLPRMTKTQRDAISSPTAGLMVYQTDNTPGLRVYNGTNWMRFTETAD